MDFEVVASLSKYIIHIANTESSVTKVMYWNTFFSSFEYKFNDCAYIFCVRYNECIFYLHESQNYATVLK